MIDGRRNETNIEGVELIMGVIFPCAICKEQAGEFDEFDDEHICDDCKDKATRLGIKMLKGGIL